MLQRATEATVGDRLRRTGTALGAVESQLRQLRLETGDILDGIDTALVTVDGAGRLQYMNRAAVKLLGIGSDDVWPRVVDTDGVGFNLFTAGSRTVPHHTTGKLAAFDCKKPITGWTSSST